MSSQTVQRKSGAITEYDKNGRIKTNISTVGRNAPTAAPANSLAMQETRNRVLRAKTKAFSDSKLKKTTTTLPETKSPKVFVLENYTGLIFWTTAKPEDSKKTIKKIYKYLEKKMPASELYVVNPTLVEEELSLGYKARLFVAYE